MHQPLKKAFYAFTTISLLTACNRPYATLQRTPTTLEPISRTTSTPSINSFSTELSTTDGKKQVIGNTDLKTTPPTIAAAITQSEVLVSASNQLTDAQKSTLTKRMSRIKRVLASTPLMNTASDQVSAKHKATAVERLIAKKINKQIQRKLSPAQPQLNVGVLSTGAVLVLIGLLLVLLTTGTAATLGIVSLLAGAVLLLVGLL